MATKNARTSRKLAGTPTIHKFVEMLDRQSAENINENAPNWNINGKFVGMLRATANDVGLKVTLRNDPDDPIKFNQGQAILRLVRYVNADADEVKARIEKANSFVKQSRYMFRPTDFDKAIVQQIRNGKTITLEDLNKLTEPLGATFEVKTAKTSSKLADDSADVLADLFGDD